MKKPGSLVAAPPLRILCVEDSDPDYDLVTEYLRKAPRAPAFELVRATRVDDALRKLRSTKNSHGFDIILTDLSLPGSKGAETFYALRDAAPNVPIAVMTDMQDHDLGLKLVKEGAQDFLPKDQLGPTFLLRSLLHAIERQRARVQLRRLHDDLKSAQLQLIQAEKLESLGRLSAGVAHEIKNPLAILQACVDYYRAKGKSEDTEQKVLNAMQEAIERATRIVGSMLDFSRDEHLVMKESDLNALLLRALDLIEPEMRTSGIDVVLDLDEDLTSVRLDPNRIEQVIVNLLVNAMQASTAGGRIKVRSFMGRVESLIPDEGIRNLDHLRHGDDIAVAEIRDYGKGIAADKLSKIFDPFFTTKAAGKGTGLGLSVSKTIVELHGGALRIQNVKPPGIRARVLLRIGDTIISDTTSTRNTQNSS